MKISLISAYLLIFLTFLSGCATYRGMPSHGGGKRFDEEQRVVAAAIRFAVQEMDLSEIKGKRIALEFANLETSGTGQPIYPGLGSVNLSSGYTDTESIIRRFQRPGEVLGVNNPTNNFDSHDEGDRWDSRVSGNFQFNPSLRTNNNITREDVNYLKKIVEMQLRHKGLQIVGAAKAEALLIVLVDVLGTNLSRIDYGLAYKDDLGATCELTYYAINPRNQVIMSPSKSVTGLGRYEETNVRFSPIRFKERSVSEFTDKIIPPFFEYGTSGEARNVELQTNGKSTVASRLDELYQRALIQLEANNRKGASSTINAIRLLDPEYQFLPELEQSLAEL